MQYKIGQIGTQFSDKDIVNLESGFTRNAEQGYKFIQCFKLQNRVASVLANQPSPTWQCM